MKFFSRSKSRKKIIQLLYAWQISERNFLEIKDEFLFSNNNNDIDINYFVSSCIEIVKNIKIIDNKISLYVPEGISRINPVENSILRLAVFEFFFKNSIPYKVTINESIELAKVFGAKNSYKLINKILDKMKNFEKIKNLKFSK
ncbi:hypothetical protein AOQ88_00545 [Candidatus Riesia sp. GBBU]|nr:hypothetical protein AOQ88_00545 [Candidatus Riesia sp. GBBU]